MNANNEYKAILETRTSKKGNPYQVLVVKFPKYDKIVFLEQAELALLNLNSSKNEEKDSDFPLDLE